MKVGILTFHSALNFGAVLQCHALYSTIKSMGHDAEVIDYRPSYLYFPRPSISIRHTIKHPIRTILSLSDIKSRQKTFDSFLSFVSTWNRSPTVQSKEELESLVDSYDVIIVGSDQVWTKRHNGNDPIWYGEGSKGATTRWITYAASAGDAILQSEDIYSLKEALSKFSNISVREQKLANAISYNFSKKVPVVLDPTLLAEENIWKQWYKPVISGDYIVVYQARQDDNTFRIAREIGEQIGVSRIIVLDNHPNVKRMGFSVSNASPSDFISIIRNAKCVVTTSFHGTAFSIITETPFYTLRLDDNKDERSHNLLSMLDLLERFVEKNASPQFIKPNFKHSKDLLKEQQTLSLAYLKEAIQSLQPF